MASPPTKSFLEPVPTRTSGSNDTPRGDVPPELGQYSILGRLGHGGMGEVFKALHRHLKRAVAIKFLLPAICSSRRGLQRFLQEMEALGQVDHPHILRATDAGEWHGRHYLVTEYLEGINLFGLVRNVG